MSTLATISDVAQAAAAIVVSVVAVAGFNVWKRQRKYDQHVDVATEIMTNVLEVQELFGAARAWMRYLPGDLDPEARKKYEAEERAREIKALSDAHTALVRSVVKLQLWRPDFCEQEIGALRKQINALTAACRAHFSIDWRDPIGDMAKLRKEVDAKIWGEPGDEFGKVVVENADRIRAECRKLVS